MRLVSALLVEINEDRETEELYLNMEPNPALSLKGENTLQKKIARPGQK